MARARRQQQLPSRDQAALFADLIAQFSPQIQRGFMASVTDLQANVDWDRLLEALELMNIDDAVAALNIEPAAWQAYSEKVSEAYAASGAGTAAQIKEMGIGGVAVRFNMKNPRAERWILENVGNRITRFNEEMIQSARLIINEGYAAGNHPYTIARDLVGRVDSRGQRVGGIMGLDAPRAARLNKVTQAMRTPEGVQSIVTQHSNGDLSVDYKVNPATEARILAAYKRGEALSEQDIDISSRQYGNALLLARAETVAATETGNAVLGARQEEWVQFAEKEGYTEDDIIKTWRHRRGAARHHRPDHLAMSGHRVRGLRTPFEFPDGVKMLHPHDLAGGAKHVINCGCDCEYRIDHTRGR